MNEANIKIVLGNNPLANGEYALYLRIIKKKKKKQINIGIRCKQEHFINEQLIKAHLRHKVENELLFRLKTRALEIIREFQLKNQDFTLDEFEQAFRGEGKNNTELCAITFSDEIIDELERSHKIGNAAVYKEIKTALIRFAGKKVLFKQITPTFLDKFEIFMRERGNEDGGISLKMRTLRALFNKAITRKLISQEIYPFRDYKISKLKPEKNKRALSVDDFKKIRDLDLTENPHLIDVHNYFLFSFYARGMNFVDMMKLKWTDIQNGRIYYTRSKTKGNFNIEITSVLQKVLDYYKSQNRPTEYVFPILLKDDLTAKQINYRKHKVMGQYNRKLKEIAQLAKIETCLTSYVARHSYATILKQIGTSTEVISESMGHADVQVTMTYLKEFENDVLDKANQKLLEL